MEEKIDKKRITVCRIIDFEGNCESIPHSSGVYRICCDDYSKVIILEPNKEDCNRVHYTIDYLSDKINHHKSNVLYIGKALNLNKRLKQYVNRIGHDGGRAIWQIDDHDKLLIQYKECDDCKAVERTLLCRFNKRQRRRDRIKRSKSFYYPFANHRK